MRVFIFSLVAGLLVLAADKFLSAKKNTDKKKRDFDKMEKPLNAKQSPGTLAEVDFALQRIKGEYGNKIARWVEQIYRLETRNFQSEQYKKSLSAGMEPANETYPYGWITPYEKVWKENPKLAPIGLTEIMTDSGGRKVRFIRFASFYAAAKSLAEYLKKYGPGRWYSTDPALSAAYVASIENIPTKFV